ncbi:hypothetical protein XENOCAPTIV_020861 [Xenoophorus captivus]|uniref:NET domain-containing protein n=1 Tax=Xenoophorus captivus TaxID=1517983 RepID=A0ABV0SB52_9TELE
MNIPQQLEGSSISVQCADNRKSNRAGSPSTSESSQSENSSDSERSSDEVAMQLAHLEEKVGLTQAQVSLNCTVYCEICAQDNLKWGFCVCRLGGSPHNDGVPTKYSEILSIPLSSQERTQLKSNIDKLPSKKLIEMVNLIKSRETCVEASESGEVEIDFEKLKTSTLRAVQQLISSSLSKCNNGRSSKYTVPPLLLGFTQPASGSSI